MTHKLDAGFFFFWLLASGIFIFIGPMLLIASILVLMLRSRDRARFATPIAYVLLALGLGMILFVLLPVLDAEMSQPTQDSVSSRHIYHLSEPHAYGGIMFPAGSSVDVQPDGTPDYVYLKSPGNVLGMMLVGDVQLGTEYKEHDLAVLTGTLAEPFNVNGIPCAPGKLDTRSNVTRCILARDYVFAGHVLAAGTSISVSGPTKGKEPKLRHGTLARQELLFDILWPPGTVVGGISETADQMAHAPEPANQEIDFCVPSGGTAIVGDAVLHGPIAYHIQNRARTVQQFCSISGSVDGTGGYIEIGTDRYTHGQRTEVYSPWQWTGRLGTNLP